MVDVRVLVTGSAGFIGAHAVRYLSDRGMEVRGLDRRSALRSARVDLADPSGVDRAVRRFAPDAIVHLGALATVPGCESDPAGCLRANVLATLNVARAASRAGARLVFASSAAVYGDGAPVPTPVETPLAPTNLYGISKLAGERICREYSENTTVLRFFNVYGEGCRRSYVIPDLIRKLAARPAVLEMNGTGSEARDFIYIEDVLRAMARSVRGRFRGTYNVGTGVRTTLPSLARQIARAMGVRAIRIHFTGARAGDFRVNHADISGSNRVPGWQPLTPLAQGLTRTIAKG